MYDHKNLQGPSPVLIKDQELANNLIKAEFAWNDAVTLDEKRKSLSLLNSALEEIEKFNNEKVEKKPSLYFDVDPSLIPTMMREIESDDGCHSYYELLETFYIDLQLEESRILQNERLQIDPSLIPTMMREMESRILQNERLQNWQNPEWMDKQDEISNLKEMGYSESEIEKYVGVLNVQWDNQSWEEQRG